MFLAVYKCTGYVIEEDVCQCFQGAVDIPDQ
jgi:hypothetical protein